MAYLMPHPHVIGALLITAISVVQLTALSQFGDEDEYSHNHCSLTLIKNTELRDITIVNVKNNEFLRDIYSLSIKIIIRSFFVMELQEPNQAYVVHCEYPQECVKGFSDLIKDIYWNPNAIFIVTIENLNQSQEIVFQKLHHLYVFKTVLVTHDRLYFYDFQISDHCSFTAGAIMNYKCDSTSLNQESLTWAHIKGSLENKYKIPYSECNMSVIVSINEPFVLRPHDNKDEPSGFEEEFIRILKRMNFTRIVYTYNQHLYNTGIVCENFTVTGILKEVQAGAIDYILGGTLLSHYRLQILDFTYPHWCDHFLLIVPKARHIHKWEVMYTVFGPLVWGLILLAFVCMSLIAFILKTNSTRNVHQLVLTALDLYGYFTNNVPKRSTTYFMLSWAMFTWLIACFYQSDLASVFTRPAYYKEVNTLQEILKRNYKLYLTKALYNVMKGNDELDMVSLVQNSTLCKNPTDCLKEVAFKRKGYTVVSRLGYLYFEAEFHDDGGEPMLHRAKAYTYVFTTGYLRKGNPNLKKIRALERKVIAYGLHRRSMLAYVHMNKLRYYKVKRNMSKPLSCNDIEGVYYVYLFGCGISLITFCIEIALNKNREEFSAQHKAS